MNRGHIHKIVADLLSAFAHTGFFYGWSHKQPPEFQILVSISASLSTKARFSRLPPKPKSCALLAEAIKVATILRNDWIDGNAKSEQVGRIDYRLKLVKQEYKILSAAEALKHGKQILD